MPDSDETGGIDAHRLHRRAGSAAPRAARRTTPSCSTPRPRPALARADPTGPVMRRVVKQMAADGWLGIGWPKEYGGQGRGPIEQFIFFDESMRAGAPGPDAHHQHGRADDHELRHRRAEGRSSCRKILAGDIHFCIGYSEPGAGTDLAALRTTRGARRRRRTSSTARRCGPASPDDADYCWLAVRTNPEVKKHKGISMIIVPMDTPGIEMQPLRPASASTTSPRCSTTTCGCPPATSSAARTTAGR